MSENDGPRVEIELLQVLLEARELELRYLKRVQRRLLNHLASTLVELAEAKGDRPDLSEAMEMVDVILAEFQKQAAKYVAIEEREREKHDDA